MKIAKNIFAGIWCAWGLITFIATFLIIFLPSMLSYLMSEMLGQRYFIIISRIWMRTWLFLVACPVKVTGKENFVEGKIILLSSIIMLYWMYPCPLLSCRVPIKQLPRLLLQKCRSLDGFIKRVLCWLIVKMKRAVLKALTP